MARPLRLEFPGALYHITSRGDRRETIFVQDGDRSMFLALFGDVCHRFDWRCHGFCLMSNHYHLVVETTIANLSRGMRQLNGVYTQRFNRCYGHVGHVFQGRYKAIVVDKDQYLLELSRYVVLNPVRVGMVHAAGEWAWSSYRAMIGKARTPYWLATDAVLGMLDRQRSVARRRYIQFVIEGKDKPSIWKQLTQELYLGDEQFVERVQRLSGNDDAIPEVPRVQTRPAAASIERIADETKNPQQAMKRAYASGYYTLKDIADFFGVHYSTVSRAVNRP